jgi:hypothetical protein
METTEPFTVESEPLSVESEPLSVESEPLSVESEPLTVDSEPLTVDSEQLLPEFCAKRKTPCSTPLRGVEPAPSCFISENMADWSWALLFL